MSRALFHYGKIHVRCVGVIEDQIWKGSTDRDGSSHNILTILLPEQLKWERPPAEFTGKEIILGYSSPCFGFNSLALKNITPDFFGYNPLS